MIDLKCEVEEQIHESGVSYILFFRDMGLMVSASDGIVENDIFQGLIVTFLGSLDRSLRMWDLKTLECVSMIENEHRINNLVQWDSNTFLAGDDGGKVLIIGISESNNPKKSFYLKKRKEIELTEDLNLGIIYVVRMLKLDVEDLFVCLVDGDLDEEYDDVKVISFSEGKVVCKYNSELDGRKNAPMIELNSFICLSKKYPHSFYVSESDDKDHNCVFLVRYNTKKNTINIRKEYSLHQKNEVYAIIPILLSNKKEMIAVGGKEKVVYIIDSETDELFFHPINVKTEVCWFYLLNERFLCVGEEDGIFQIFQIPDQKVSEKEKMNNNNNNNNKKVKVVLKKKKKKRKKKVKEKLHCREVLSAVIHTTDILFIESFVETVTNEDGKFTERLIMYFAFSDGMFKGFSVSGKDKNLLITQKSKDNTMSKNDISDRISFLQNWSMNLMMIELPNKRFENIPKLFLV